MELSQSRYRRLEFQSDLNEHIRIVDGGTLPPVPMAPDGYVPALVHARVAEELSFRVGDLFSFSPLDEYDSQRSPDPRSRCLGGRRSVRSLLDPGP